MAALQRLIVLHPRPIHRTRKKALLYNIPVLVELAMEDLEQDQKLPYLLEAESSTLYVLLASLEEYLQSLAWPL